MPFPSSGFAQLACIILTLRENAWNKTNIIFLKSLSICITWRRSYFHSLSVQIRLIRIYMRDASTSLPHSIEIATQRHGIQRISHHHGFSEPEQNATDITHLLPCVFFIRCCCFFFIFICCCCKCKTKWACCCKNYALSQRPVPYIFILCENRTLCARPFSNIFVCHVHKFRAMGQVKTST